tara:strand:+ start:3410 stop:3925 length:516 start_codon:yes stop_codon:yes gene_type:complete
MKIYEIIQKLGEEQSTAEMIDSEIDDEIGPPGNRRPGYEGVDKAAVKSVAIGKFTTGGPSITPGIAVKMAMIQVHPDIEDKIMRRNSSASKSDSPQQTKKKDLNIGPSKSVSKGWDDLTHGHLRKDKEIKTPTGPSSFDVKKSGKANFDSGKNKAMKRAQQLKNVIGSTTK